eukprot:CAMPEP_0204527266 /NCGR_PEP_ID=MMETSP0661-20131031/8889_1 /ASSEMBLY_ACC=CAM_ASM_000606 /TAXON_ID=109239 /ORGANISM="Alexandrium margalefi, Strain AMGDE01CS-322" /LENGTH=283 /DNA_ID=CAMNT_0051533161 /DNA_START=38 /DNA_END=885 /DNA_ORIENTATION=-
MTAEGEQFSGPVALGALVGSLAWLAPLAPGMAHAVTSVVIGAPFDTVKTRLQVGMHSSAWQCVQSTLRREGPVALYRGALMPMAALSVKRPVEFAAFEWCNSRFGGTSAAPFLGGFTAGCISAFMGCPFSVVKVQMQASSKDVYRHTFHAVADVWRSKGPLGFYRGLGASLIMSVPSTTFYLGVYGVLRERLPASRSSTALAGVVASLSMWTCLLPLDNVRTVIQAKSFKRDEPISRWGVQFVEIVRTRGVLGLWAGWTAMAMRAPLVSGCAMLAYEQARSLA